MSNVEQIELVWENYKNNPNKTPELKTSILEHAKISPNVLWKFIFSPDKELSRRLSLQETEQVAQESKDNYVNPFMLDIMVNTAYINCRNVSGLQEDFDQDRINIWNNVFSPHPEFSIAFKEKLEEGKMKNSQLLGLLTTPETVYETVSIIVPYSFMKNNEPTLEINEEAVNTVLEHYNFFKLHMYMNLPFVCVATHLEAKYQWVFSFDIGEKLEGEKRITALEALKHKLSHQLQTGWGASVCGEVLDGVDLYKPGFDCKNMVINTEKKGLKIKH
jgi:hypothetical protein